MAQLPIIARCPFVVRALDIAESWDSFFLFELAEDGLDAYTARRAVAQADVAAIRDNIAAALHAMHAIDYVHCDVQPSNILRVRGVWKLSDLGGAVRVGAPIEALPRDSRFVPPGVLLGTPARPELDIHALERVVATLVPATEGR